MRSRDYQSLNAEVENGQHSTGWCNLANVGYRVGTQHSINDVGNVDVGMEAWPLVLDEMKSQLTAFGVNPTDASIHMSPLLTHDPETERFTGNNADVANQFLKREYQGEFVVPENV